MRRAALASFLVLFTGCSDWPEPVIRSITPAQMVASQTTAVEVRADLPLPTTVDYADGTASVDAAAVLRIGRQELGSGVYPKDGVFTVEVPTVFEPGSYDVTITLEDGRQAILPQGFTVSEGAWPEGYTIDPVGPQRRLVPFDVTIRATGANAASFRGNVRLEVPAGASVGPALSGQFVDGVLTQQVVINTTRAEELLIVTDVAGNRSTSNTFQVQ